MSELFLVCWFWYTVLVAVSFLTHCWLSMRRLHTLEFSVENTSDFLLFVLLLAIFPITFFFTLYMDYKDELHRWWKGKT